MDMAISERKMKMKDKAKILEKTIWAISFILFVFVCGTATIMDNWLGYTYMALMCVAIFIDDFKIVKGYWVQFIPIPLTIAYLLYEHEPTLYILKNIFNW